MNKFKLMILCDDALSAKSAQDAGIDRVFYDLEYVGKAERQAGRNAVLSHNDIDNIPKIRSVITESELLVRTNPIHPYSRAEIEKSIDYGADVLMLPMVIDHHDVEQYVKMIGGRAKVCIMIETAAAMARLDKILAVPGVDEVFIGLNDLHLSMGLTFMFELLSGGLIEFIANKCNCARIPFGFGGIARIGEGLLPSDYILGEHLRLGSSSVILSRTFKGVEGVDLNARRIDLVEEVNKVRDRMRDIENWSDDDYARNRDAISDAVEKVVEKILSR